MVSSFINRGNIEDTPTRVGDVNGVNPKEIDIKNIRNEEMGSVILVNVVGLNPYS